MNAGNEKGIALILALLILLVLTLVGMGAVGTTYYESKISGNERLGAVAFYASEAGVQEGLRRLPETSPIPRTALNQESAYWSGSPQDKNAPKALQSFGKYDREGSDSNWEYRRFQVNATGESFNGVKEVEIQVCYGPFASGTAYNN